MNDLTKAFKLLQSLHSESRKEAMSFVFINCQDITNLHPLIIKPKIGIILKYNSEYKEIQKKLIRHIKDFLYGKAEMDILHLIKETNGNLYLLKSKECTDSPVQLLINSRLDEVINSYIRLNLIVSSYIKDIQVLSQVKGPTSLEIKDLKKQVHHLITQ